MSLTLYFTSGCHLCEQAHALVEQCLAEQASCPHFLQMVDIAESPTLLDRYGISIPVLRNEESGFELQWPFAAEDVRKIL